MSDARRNATHQLGHAVLIYHILPGPHGLFEMRAISHTSVKRDETEQLPYNLNLSLATDSRKSRIAIALGGLAAESAFNGQEPDELKIESELRRHGCSEWAEHKPNFRDWLAEAKATLEKHHPGIESLIERLQDKGVLEYSEIGNIVGA